MQPTFVTECVRKLGGESRLTVFAADTLGNGYDNGFVSRLRFFYIGEEFIGRERRFGKIYEMRRRFAVRTEHAGGSREPACISAHNFNYCNGRNRINTAVADNFLQCRSNILCCRAEPRSVVGVHYIVVDSLGNADDLYVDARFPEISIKLHNGVH